MGLPIELRLEIYKKALPSLITDHEIRIKSYETKVMIKLWPVHLKAAIFTGISGPLCATFAALLSSSETIRRELTALRPNFEFVIELNEKISLTAIREVLAYDALNNTPRNMTSESHFLWSFCTRVRFDVRFDSLVPTWRILWEQWNILNFTLKIYQFPEIPFELVYRKPERTVSALEESISFDPWQITLRLNATIDDLFAASKKRKRGFVMQDVNNSKSEGITVVRNNNSVRLLDTPGKSPERKRSIHPDAEVWMRKAMVLCGKVPLGI